MSRVFGVCVMAITMLFDNKNKTKEVAEYGENNVSYGDGGIRIGRSEKYSSFDITFASDKNPDLLYGEHEMETYRMV